ncbi:Xaa-Pro aminopeptidase [Halogranum gelatinilyticum]|uniref:Xaa-Pro aminopeptidase n=1 Tax=Halogranum gelatinilyticum TaxID=660521 RepID=A0A1G9RCP9_9EURY|nr:Xaa-Pro peptidase family protein [Halogranum gelatinilyticum]SDM20931.1 Xaa-Pro aminopeptidase [Halogranum gelatinilyticum]
MTPFERRTRDCQARLREGAGDALVLFPSQNLFYLSGFSEDPAERHLLLFVPAEGEPVFLVPDLYAEQIREASWIPELRTWADEDDPREHLRAVAAELDLAGGHLLVDDTMWAQFTQDLRTVLPDATFGLASEVVAPLRLRKDDAELDALRRAGAVADDVVDELRSLGEDAVGMTEAELAADIERRLTDAGGSGASFEIIVGSGPNGAKPHHSHGERVVEAGDPVVLDFGTRVDGYPSDQTRTLVFAGDPDDEFVEVHDVVREAHDAAVAAVEPGVTAGEIDAAARDVVDAAGYGERFIHRTGHGVGLDVHEEPYIVAGSEVELEPGMVFSVEPGVYLPGEFGVRIEDLVVVTDDGCERLNDTDRGWR